VSPQLVECGQNSLGQCLLIREDENDNWVIFNGKIENFDYQEGFLYLLKVKRVQIDKESYNYNLVSILNKKPTNLPKINLKNTAWKIAQYQTDSSAELQTFNFDQMIKFEPDNNKFSGSGGCNSFYGTYNLSNNIIEFNDVVSTEKLCPDEIMAEEKAILDILNTADKVEMEDGLVILSPIGKLHLTKQQ